MIKRSDRLSNYQYSALIISTIIGVVVIGLPRLAGKAAGKGALLATFLGGILAVIMAALIALLGRRYKDKTIIEYSVILLGKIPGKLMGALILLYFVLATSIILRSFSDALKGLLLKNTPLEIIMITMLLTSIYLALNGVSTIAKLSELFLPIIVLSLLLVIGLSISNFDYIRFMPVLTPAMIPVVKGIPDLMTAFQGYEIIFLVIPFMYSHKKIIPFTILGVGIPVILYTLLVGISVGVLGLKAIEQLNYPAVTLAEKINFPGGFAERFDIFFVFLWILAAFSSQANFFYMASLTTVRIFGLTNYQPFIYLLAPIVYILAILPQNLIEMQAVTKYTGYMGIGISILTVALLLLTLASKKGRSRDV
ncbi:MAG: endospore germination permease [Clostridiales bacterium]|nr:endospore germination permease [Clostridiales bacterium]